MEDLICARNSCNNTFKYRSNKEYCCRSCKQKNRVSRSPDLKKKAALKLKLRRKPYILHKKDHCEYCNFIPIHTCQLDVDHIDGNHKNNNISNLQTLCANCHRLKTHMNEDWKFIPKI